MTSPSSPPSTAGDPHEHGHLSRSLTHRQMAMIAMGSALGTGLFLGSGDAIAVAGPAVIISFAIGSAIAMTIALAMGEMASRHPVQGGFGTLAARYLSPFWGYLVRWLYWIVTVGVTAAELYACSLYLQFWAPDLPQWAGVAILGAIVVAINVVSVKSFGTIEFWLSSIKVIAVVVFILVGLCLVFFGLPGTPAAGVSNWTNDGGFMPFGFKGVWVSMALVMFSFGGIEMLSISAAEAKDPARSIRTAAQSSVVRLSFFYVAAIGIIVALVPWKEASGAAGDVRLSPFVMVFHELGIPAAAGLTNLIVVITALSAANANVYAGSRFLHSLAADSLAPRVLERTTTRGIPLPGIIVHACGIFVVVVLAMTGIGGLFPLIMSTVIFSAVIVWTLILVTYIVYHRTRDGRELFRMPGGVVTAVAGIAGLLFVFSTVIAVERMQLAAMVGIPFVLLVTLAYVLVFRHRISVDAIDASFAEAEKARADFS